LHLTFLKEILVLFCSLIRFFLQHEKCPFLTSAGKGNARRAGKSDRDQSEAGRADGGAPAGVGSHPLTHGRAARAGREKLGRGAEEPGGRRVARQVRGLETDAGELGCDRKRIWGQAKMLLLRHEMRFCCQRRSPQKLTSSRFEPATFALLS